MDRNAGYDDKPAPSHPNTGATRRVRRLVRSADHPAPMSGLLNLLEYERDTDATRRVRRLVRSTDNPAPMAGLLNLIKSQTHQIEQEAYRSVVRAFIIRYNELPWAKVKVLLNVGNELNVSKEATQLITEVEAEYAQRNVVQQSDVAGPSDTIAVPNTAAVVEEVENLMKSSQDPRDAERATKMLNEPEQPLVEALEKIDDIERAQQGPNEQEQLEGPEQ